MIAFGPCTYENSERHSAVLVFASPSMGKSSIRSDDWTPGQVC